MTDEFRISREQYRARQRAKMMPSVIATILSLIALLVAWLWTKDFDIAWQIGLFAYILLGLPALMYSLLYGR